MAPRLDSTNNVDFLYKCIESNGVKIDFNKAGRALGLKPNAARMRYQRLQKSLESGLAVSAMPTAMSTPKKAGKKRKQLAPAKGPPTNKKRKVEEDCDSVVVSDSDVDPTSGINELIKESNKRNTRGIKTDYSEILARPTLLKEKDSSEEASDLISESETSMYEDSRSKPATPSRVIQSIEQTPPPTADSVKQVSVSPQMTEDDDESAVGSSLHVTPTPAQTPTRVAKKTKSRERSLISHEEPAVDVRDELDALKCGQRVSESMFKKRKHIQIHSTLNTNSLPAPHPHPHPHPRPPPNLRSFQDDRRSGRHDGADTDADADEETLELAMIGDSVCPDDSISMAGEMMIKHEVEKTALRKSFLQRVSQFWKQQ